jgi:hypothetical protein
MPAPKKLRSNSTGRTLAFIVFEFNLRSRSSHPLSINLRRVKLRGRSPETREKRTGKAHCHTPRGKIPILGADAVQMAEGNTFGRVIASAWTTRRGQRPWHVQTLLAREPGDLAIDRSATAVKQATGTDPIDRIHHHAIADGPVADPFASDWTPLLAGLSPAGMAASLAARSITTKLGCRRDVRFSPFSDQIADIAWGPFRARSRNITAGRPSRARDCHSGLGIFICMSAGMSMSWLAENVGRSWGATTTTEP